MGGRLQLVELVELVELVFEVEDLLEPDEALVRRRVVEVHEELGHLGLPSGVDVGLGHPRLGGLERRRLEVADEQAVGAQEE